jgi:hypothetical protein
MACSHGKYIFEGLHRIAMRVGVKVLNKQKYAHLHQYVRKWIFVWPFSFVINFPFQDLPFHISRFYVSKKSVFFFLNHFTKKSILMLDKERRKNKKFRQWT